MDGKEAPLSCRYGLDERQFNLTWIHEQHTRVRDPAFLIDASIWRGEFREVSVGVEEKSEKGKLGRAYVGGCT